MAGTARLLSGADLREPLAEHSLRRGLLGIPDVFRPSTRGRRRDSGAAVAARREAQAHYRRQRPGCDPGRDLAALHEDGLWAAAEQTDLFVEVDPNQKERIIRSLKKAGHVVGFRGDGVNDAPAMHAADTSLAVEEAVDVAREAADFVLLERGLDVIR